MKQTILRWCWNALLVSVAVWMLFDLTGSPFVLKCRYAFHADGIDLMRLSGVCGRIVLLVALLGILVGLSSPFSGTLPLGKRILLTIWSLTSIALTVCSGALKLVAYENISSLAIPLSFKTIAGSFVGEGFIPMLLLLAMAVLALKRKKGPWQSLTDLFSYFKTPAAAACPATR